MYLTGFNRDIHPCYTYSSMCIRTEQLWTIKFSNPITLKFHWKLQTRKLIVFAPFHIIQTPKCTILNNKNYILEPSLSFQYSTLRGFIKRTLARISSSSTAQMTRNIHKSITVKIMLSWFISMIIFSLIIRIGIKDGRKKRFKVT